MRCGKVKKMLGAYLDGELSDRKTSKVKKHLVGCSSCLWELRSFQKVDELGQCAVILDEKHLPSWEDYMADLHGKLGKTKAEQRSWIICLYDGIRYAIPDFVSYWFWKMLPGLAFALVIIGLFYGINYIRNGRNNAPQDVNTAQVAISSKQESNTSKSMSADIAKQEKSDPQKLTFNFYLKEHRNAIMQQASYTDQPPQKSIELDGNDVLYYDTIRGANQGWQGDAGIFLRAPRRNVPTKADTTQPKKIADSHSLSVEQVNKSVSFKPILPQTLYPGYLLESIKKLDGKDCLHLIYTNGINTLSIFEQPASDKEKLYSSELKEYVMYSKEGDDPANIIGWNSNGVSFTIIGNEDFPQLINITREIQGVKSPDDNSDLRGSTKR